MKIKVINYSYTGNNRILATKIASELSAELITLEEKSERHNGKILIDLLFNFTPKLKDFNIECLDENDLVIFVGPIWMGKVATPLRECFKKLKNKLTKYAYFSLSGGASGSGFNSNIDNELTKRLGKAPDVVLDQHIARLLPSNPTPTRYDTGSFRLKAQEHIDSLSKNVIEVLHVSKLI